MGYTGSYTNYCFCVGGQGCHICNPRDWVKREQPSWISYTYSPLEYRFTLDKILPKEIFEI